MHRAVLALLVGIVGSARLAAVEQPYRIFKIGTGSTPISVALNPATGQLFVLDPDGHLMILDEVTRQASVVVVPSNTFALTVDSSANRVYASSFAYPFFGNPVVGGMTVVDPTTGQTDFVFDSYLGAPMANSSTHRVYVTRPYYAYHTGVGFHSLVVFDGQTLAKHDVLITGSRSVALAVDEIHDRIYVATMGDTAERSDTLTIVDGSKEQALDVTVGCPMSFPGASGTNNVVVDSGANRAWVTCYADPRMLMVEPDSLEVSAYPLEGTPTLFAVNPATHKLYVTLDGRSELIEIDPSLRVAREILLAEPVSGLAVNAKSNMVYAVHSGGTVTLVDGDSHDTAETEVGPGGSSIIVDSARDIAWVVTTEGVTGLFGSDSPCARCPRVVRRPPD